MKFYSFTGLLITGIALSAFVSCATESEDYEGCIISGEQVNTGTVLDYLNAVPLNLQDLMEHVGICWRNHTNFSFTKVKELNDTEEIHQTIVNMCDQDFTQLHNCVNGSIVRGKCMTAEDQDRLQLHILHREMIRTIGCRDNATLYTDLHVGQFRIDPRTPPGTFDFFTECYRKAEADLGTQVEGVNNDIMKHFNIYSGTLACLEHVETPGWLEAVTAYKKLLAAFIENLVCMDHTGGSQVLCKSLLQA